MIVFALPERLLGASQALSGVDAVASATPLVMQGNWSYMDLLLGNIPGTIGEVSKIAILIGFLYLLLGNHPLGNSAALCRQHHCLAGL